MGATFHGVHPPAYRCMPCGLCLFTTRAVISCGQGLAGTQPGSAIVRACRPGTVNLGEPVGHVDKVCMCAWYATQMVCTYNYEYTYKQPLMIFIDPVPTCPVLIHYLLYFFSVQMSQLSTAQ